MRTRNIFYRRGYSLSRPFTIDTPIHPAHTIKGPFMQLHPDGTLELEVGRYSDGASGYPDTRRIMRGAFLHDAFYEFFRLGLLDASIWKPIADEFLEQCASDDGMPHLLADAIGQAVLKFGDTSTQAGGGAPEYYAPGLDD